MAYLPKDLCSSLVGDTPKADVFAYGKKSKKVKNKTKPHVDLSLQL
jgi:hypothetical protein